MSAPTAPPRPPPVPPLFPTEPFLDPINVPRTVIARMEINLKATARTIRLVEYYRRRIAGRPSRYYRPDAPDAKHQNIHLRNLAVLSNTLITEIGPYAEELRGTELLDRMDQLSDYVDRIQDHFERMRAQYMRQAGFVDAVRNCSSLKRFLADEFGFAGAAFGNAECLEGGVIDWRERREPERKEQISKEKKRGSKQKEQANP